MVFPDASDRVRLRTSLRLLTVIEVTSLEDELSTCLFLCLRTRRSCKADNYENEGDNEEKAVHDSDDDDDGKRVFG